MILESPETVEVHKAQSLQLTAVISNITQVVLLLCVS